VADEVRSHPPTARRLGRLWARGITPASPALVGALMLSVGALITALAWPWLVAQAGGALTGALAEASRRGGGCVDPTLQPILGFARRALLGAWALVAGIGAALLVVAVVAHQVQLGPRGESVPATEDLPGGATPGRARPPGAELGWLGLSALLPLLAVLVAARAALAGGPALPCADAARALAAAAALAKAVGAPLLAALLGFGLLDLLVRRAEFMAAASMSRRELEEELRMSEGHPLARQRRRQSRSERGDAH